ncbi:MAG: PhzF family phenazine biosynthesis protein [Bryobacterales bacterium]|nr:PhzF family phenazine biosynthesis protein [Bryobacterales bacterium]
MPLRVTQVDAFAGQPFAGNPAAVCVLPDTREDEWLQSVAREMNLSETAFLWRQPDNSFELRWFTPSVEVDLCGHATLASAHVLWEEGYLGRAVMARFHTRSGLLTAAARGAWIELDFPATPASEAEPPKGLAEALGLTPLWTGRTRFDYLVEADSEETVRRLTPDFTALRRLPVRGVIVTAPGREFDCVSRFFAPVSGIDEDPVTGSAHCALGPHWASRLGKKDLVAFQASARGGVLRVRVSGDRVGLAGQAVTILRGELLC